MKKKLKNSLNSNWLLCACLLAVMAFSVCPGKDRQTEAYSSVTRIEEENGKLENMAAEEEYNGQDNLTAERETYNETGSAADQEERGAGEYMLIGAASAGIGALVGVGALFVVVAVKKKKKK